MQAPKTPTLGAANLTGSGSSTSAAAASSSSGPIAIQLVTVPVAGPPPDLHWTTYVQAIGAPVVAVVAAAIAASIAYRQWKTAQVAAHTARNKLKLDLFERRFTVYADTRQLIATMCNIAEHDREATFALMAKLGSSEFLFDESVRAYIEDELVAQAGKVLSLEWRRRNAVEAHEHSLEREIADEHRATVNWFCRQSQDDTLKRHLRPFLQLTH